jgi:hypothetical protein
LNLVAWGILGSAAITNAETWGAWMKAWVVAAGVALGASGAWSGAVLHRSTRHGGDDAGGSSEPATVESLARELTASEWWWAAPYQ